MTKIVLGVSAAVGGWLIYRLTSGGGVESGILLVYVGLVVFVLLKRKRGEPVANESEEAHDLQRVEGVVLGIIREKGKAKRADLLPHVGISKSSLVRLLDHMEAKGLIVQVGERKASFYALPTSKT